MGKVTDSLISGSSGRTGRVVVANVNGIEILKIRPKKSSKPSSDKQNLIKDRFNKSIFFMESYKEYAKQFFGTKKGLASRYNQAAGVVLKALECDMDNYTITPNYAKIQFSKGIGLRPQPTAISSPQALKIQIDWEDNSLGGPSQDDQLVVLVAEDQNLEAETLFYYTQTTRGEQTHQITLLPRYQNKEMHLWIAFVDTNEMYASNSIYIGSIRLT